MAVPISYNIRNLIERKGTTLMTAFGIGLTVAVLVTAMALTTGLSSVFGGTGDPRQVLVMRKGVTAELSSTVSPIPTRSSAACPASPLHQRVSRWFRPRG